MRGIDVLGMRPYGFGNGQRDIGVHMGKSSGLLIVALVCSLFACRPQVAGVENLQSASPTTTVKVTELFPTDLWPTPTPVICTPLPPGMTLSAEPISPKAVKVEITGLKAGERLILVFHAENP